eukprot:1113656-Pyramimonas_sp.AAC.1
MQAMSRSGSLHFAARESLGTTARSSPPAMSSEGKSSCTSMGRHLAGSVTRAQIQSADGSTCVRGSDDIPDLSAHISNTFAAAISKRSRSPTLS